ncbi:MAG: FHA domain-containing protein [Candidatus Contendobacter sp.]|nr:FHA domain-containing protein [Candidatus Contendobacter sp.]MDG4559449.1 FHA domain-containing protein [Candidatus Contendobacter sp.]
MKLTFWPFSRRRANPPETTVTRARFIRTDMPGKGDLRLRSPLCRLGRLPENDLFFNNNSVSSRHAEIYHLPDGTFQICDLGSTNGTRVNGQPVQSQVLHHGDVVELGEVRLHFRIDG